MNQINNTNSLDDPTEMNEFINPEIKEHVVDAERIAQITNLFYKKQNKVSSELSYSEQNKSVNASIDPEVKKELKWIRTKQRLFMQILNFALSILVLVSVTLFGFFIFAFPYNLIVGSVCLVLLGIFTHKNFKKYIRKD